MSDENGSKQHAAAGVVDHRCEYPGCGEWGGFGFAASRAVAPRWWCARHYPYWDEPAKAKYAALPV